MSETIVTRRCSKCKNVKDVSEFHRSTRNPSGCKCRCKDCRRLDAAMPRSMEQGRIRKRKYKKTEKGRVTERRYRHTNKGKALMARYRAKSDVSLKRQAGSAVAYAILVNQLPRPSTFTCKCGEAAQIYHHPNYTKEYWLDVVPLCRKCHWLIHKALAV